MKKCEDKIKEMCIVYSRLNYKGSKSMCSTDRKFKLALGLVALWQGINKLPRKKKGISYNEVDLV
jgi:hypothetical protein